MSHFKLYVDGVTTGSTANTYKTILGLKLPDVAGNRARLRKLFVSGAGGAGQDVQVSTKLVRTGNTADGTSTAVNVNTIGKADPASRASCVSAIGKNYSAEPETPETGAVGGVPQNARNTAMIDWGPDEAPVWGPNQTLCIMAAPSTAAAVTLGILVEWEEF